MWLEVPIGVCDERGTYGGVWGDPPVSVIWEEIRDLPNSKLRLWAGRRENVEAVQDCPKTSEHWRKEDAFIVTEKKHYSLGLFAGEHTFSSGEKGTTSLPVWINQSYEPNNRFSKQGALPGLWLPEEENAGKIDIYFVKDKSIIQVRWRILLHFHSFLTMWKQLIFKISNGCQEASEACIFLTSSKSFLKNKYG